MVDARKTQVGPIIVVIAESNVQLSSVPEGSPSRVTMEVVVACEATYHKGCGRHTLATALPVRTALRRTAFLSWHAPWCQD